MAGNTSKTLTVVYHSGSPDGIISISLKHTPVHMYIVPREELKEAKKIEGIHRPGFYFLVDPDEDKKISRIYVGQTVKGIERMFDHYKKKEWWTKSIMILGDSDTFNLDMLSGLEKYGMDKINVSGYIVDNDKDSQYVLKPDILDDVEWIFEKTEFLLATQGYSLVKKKRHKKATVPPVPPGSSADAKPSSAPPAESAEEAEQTPSSSNSKEAGEQAQHAPQAGSWISLDKEFNPTGYKPMAYSFSGKMHEVKSFRDFLKETVALLHDSNKTAVGSIADGGHALSGRINRTGGFTRTAQIGDTGIYFEANLSAEDVMRTIRSLAKECGVSASSIRICLNPTAHAVESLPACEEPSAPPAGGNVQITIKDVTAYGKYDPDTGELTVLEGSQINLATDTAKGPAKAARDAALSAGDIAEEGGRNVLKKAYTFSTPSSAGSFVLGRSSNGWLEWRDAGGIPLKEMYPQG